MTRARLAALLLAGSQLPWLPAAFAQFGTERAPVAGWILFSLLAILALAAGFWSRPARFQGPALYAAWYVLLFSSFWAYQQKDPLLWVGAAAGAGAILLVSLTRKKEPEPQPVPAQAGASLPLGPWARENVEALIIAFVMALVIRCFCIQIFKIPTGSMEPTLLGDVEPDRHSLESCPFRNEHVGSGGDRIMVTKYFYEISDVERFDVLVFVFPLNTSRNIIKRVVGLPGEKILVYDGNIYHEPPGESGFRIARKPDRIQDALWIDALGGADPLRDAATFRSFWKARDAAAWEASGGVLETRAAGGELGAAFDFAGREHPIELERGPAVGDVRIDFEFQMTGRGGEVFAEVSNAYGRFEAVLPEGRPGRFLHDGPGRKQIRDPSEGLRVEMDRWHRFELSIFDGTARARLDGKPVEEIAFIGAYDEIERDPDFRRTGVTFGARGAPFRVRNLRLGRDVHYVGRNNFPERKGVAIPEGHFVMMGDNVMSSHDGRGWTKETFKLTDGRIVVCEGLETDYEPDEEAKQDLKRRYTLKTMPTKWIASDQHGVPWGLYTKDPEDLPAGAPVGVIEEELPPAPYPFLDGNYVVGKGFWVWFPLLSRWKLIR